MRRLLLQLVSQSVNEGDSNAHQNALDTFLRNLQDDTIGGGDVIMTMAFIFGGLCIVLCLCIGCLSLLENEQQLHQDEERGQRNPRRSFTQDARTPLLLNPETAGSRHVANAEGEEGVAAANEDGVEPGQAEEEKQKTLGLV